MITIDGFGGRRSDESNLLRSDLMEMIMIDGVGNRRSDGSNLFLAAGRILS